MYLKEETESFGPVQSRNLYRYFYVEVYAILWW